MPQIQAGETFVVGQQFTATRANNHVNGATLLNGAITEQLVPGTTVSPTDSILLTYSTARNRLEKVPVESFLANAQDITASGNITFGGTLAGPEFNFGDGITSICNLNAAGFHLVSIDTEINTGNFDLQVSGVGGANIQSSGGPIAIQSSWVDPIGAQGNIIINGDLDITNAYITDNGNDITFKLKGPVCYDETIELNNTIHAWRSDPSVPVGNTTPENFDLPYPAGARILYTDTVIVPAGEKWVISYELRIFDADTDDGWYAGWFVGNTLTQLHQWSQGGSYYGVNNDFGFKVIIDNTSGVSSVTQVITFRFAFLWGTSSDFVRFSDFKGRTSKTTPPNPSDYANVSKWEKLTRKYIA